MVLVGICAACQYGRHDGHTPVIQQAPPGMLGGAECGCTGDCAGNMPASADFTRFLKPLPADASTAGEGSGVSPKQGDDNTQAPSPGREAH